MYKKDRDFALFSTWDHSFEMTTHTDLHIAHHWIIYFFNTNIKWLIFLNYVCIAEGSFSIFKSLRLFSLGMMVLTYKCMKSEFLKEYPQLPPEFKQLQSKTCLIRKIFWSSAIICPLGRQHLMRTSFQIWLWFLCSCHSPTVNCL